jgi:phosphoribosylanthranilate isomerase
MTFIKICGITSEDVALETAAAGADYIGMVFAKSPREVTPEVASKITAALKKNKTRVKTVGVFVNTSPLVLNAIAAHYNLDYIQLSGDETLEYCTSLTCPLIKAFHLSDGASVEKAITQMNEIKRTIVDKNVIFLLDTAAREKYGGTGAVFNWDLARSITRRHPVIIAGGLNPDNVGGAINTLKPWGVDVSSGVETEGKKDMKKIVKFIKAVRQADAM